MSLENPEITKLESAPPTVTTTPGYVLQVLKHEGFESEAFRNTHSEYFDELDRDAQSKYPNDQNANVEADIKKIELYIEIKKRVPTAYSLDTLLDQIEESINSAEQQDVTHGLVEKLNDMFNEVNHMSEGTTPNLNEK